MHGLYQHPLINEPKIMPLKTSQSVMAEKQSLNAAMQAHFCLSAV